MYACIHVMHVCMPACMHVCMYVWNGMAWHGVAWHSMAWHGMAWYGMVWYAGMVRYCTVQYGTVRYGMIWYSMVCKVCNICKVREVRNVCMYRSRYSFADAVKTRTRGQARARIVANAAIYTHPLSPIICITSQRWRREGQLLVPPALGFLAPCGYVKSPPQKQLVKIGNMFLARNLRPQQGSKGPCPIILIYIYFPVDTAIHHATI